MKQIQKITALSLVAILLLTAGCIKDRGVTAPTKQQPPSAFTIDFPNQSETGALDIVAAPTIYTFYVELNASTGNYPTGSVTIAKNAALVAPHTFLPDSVYTLVSPTATFDPVTHQAAFQLSIKTTKIDLSGDFAVGYTIASTTTGATIASNKKDIVIIIGAKNKYDGVYSLRCNTTGWVGFGIADGIAWDFPGDYYLITLGINSDAAFSTFTGGYLIPGATGGVGFVSGFTQFGAVTPVYYFDVATNAVIDVHNTTPDDGRGRFLFMNPAISTSRFDPATHNIYAAFYLTQVGRPNMYIYDTLTYIGPRP